MKKILSIVILVAAVIGLGFYLYKEYRNELEMRNPKFYSGNGRLEAMEIYVSARLPGRVEKIFVKEGDLVRKGDKLVQMQTSMLEAQKATMIAKIKTQEGEIAMAKATLKMKESVLSGTAVEYKRENKMFSKNVSTQKKVNVAETEYLHAVADVEYAKANILAAEGRLAEQKAELRRIEEDIRDSLLTARYDGRIQYLLAHEGEVLSAGGRAMNLVNLTDSYMTFFLPTRIAGKVRMGAEVKLIFDAAPEQSINAKVTFIDPVAQFTPKSVETKVEREKLMFRVKAHVNAELLRKYISDVKTGVSGVAWVKVDPSADWKDAPVAIPPAE